MRDYWTTADTDPSRVYHDVLIALDEARGINNGQPSLWARLFDQLNLSADNKSCMSELELAITARSSRRLLVGKAG